MNNQNLETKPESNSSNNNLATSVSSRKGPPNLLKWIGFLVIVIMAIILYSLKFSLLKNKNVGNSNNLPTSNSIPSQVGGVTNAEKVQITSSQDAKMRGIPADPLKQIVPLDLQLGPDGMTSYTLDPSTKGSDFAINEQYVSGEKIGGLYSSTLQVLQDKNWQVTEDTSVNSSTKKSFSSKKGIFQAVLNFETIKDGTSINILVKTNNQ